MSTYNIHGGHNYHVCGIVSYLNEVKEDRKISNELQKILVDEGHTVYDCTDNSARTQRGNLNNIVKKCNRHNARLNVSIHLNGCYKAKADGKTKGVEVWVSSMNSSAVAHARRVCKEMEKLGFTNRGVKGCKENGRSLAVIRQTSAPTILIEVCFADDEDDILLYKKVGYKTISRAIAKGILGRELSKEKPTSKSFKVRVKRTLTVWAKPKRGAKRLMKVHEGDIYTIDRVVKANNVTYGHLLSDAGWLKIPDKYVERLR